MAKLVMGSTAVQVPLSMFLSARTVLSGYSEYNCLASEPKVTKICTLFSLWFSKSTALTYRGDGSLWKADDILSVKVSVITIAMINRRMLNMYSYMIILCNDIFDSWSQYLKVHTWRNWPIKNEFLVSWSQKSITNLFKLVEPIYYSY
jgi:hypothetical protein